MVVVLLLAILLVVLIPPTSNTGWVWGIAIGCGGVEPWNVNPSYIYSTDKYTCIQIYLSLYIHIHIYLTVCTYMHTYIIVLRETLEGSIARYTNLEIY